MLAAPREDTYAVFKGSDIVNCLKEIDTRWQENNKISKVELWKYDLGLFAKDGEVDPVSLAMSLSDNTDERVEGELQSSLEEHKWQRKLTLLKKNSEDLSIATEGLVRESVETFLTEVVPEPVRTEQMGLQITMGEALEILRSKYL